MRLLSMAVAVSVLATVAALLSSSPLAVPAAAAPADRRAASADPPPTPVTTAARAMLAVDVATGPDGNLWFTNEKAGPLGNPGYIGRITPAGVLTAFDSVPVTAGSIVAGPDGNMWFTAGAAIGRISMAGTVTMFPLADDFRPTELAVGPDGNLWFTARFSAVIGKMTTGGVVTLLPAQCCYYPGPITAGPDGNLWYLGDAQQGGALVRMTTEGVATAFPLGFAEHPTSLAGGPDGNVWFTVQDDQSVHRITPTGVLTAFPDATPGQPLSIIAGPDGDLWYARSGSETLGRMTTAGVATALPLPAGAWPGALARGPGSSVVFTSRNAIGSLDTTSGVTTMLPGSTIVGPEHIVAGPDGNVWFTNDFVQQITSGNLLVDAISRVTPDGVVTTFTDPLIDEPGEIVVGPDGALWASVYAGLIRIAPNGAVTKVVDGVYGSMVLGADGNLWLAGASILTRVTATGAATTFSDPTMGYVRSMTSGPDGALWFLTGDEQVVHRMTLAGAHSTFPISVHLAEGRSDITTGGDGNLWLTLPNGVGRLTPTGTFTVFTDALIDYPGGISRGPDGNIWFVNAAGYQRSGSVVQVAPDGTFTHHIGSDLTFANDIAQGPDGGMWVTNTLSDAILHVDVPGRTTTPAAPTTVVATAGDHEAIVRWNAPVWRGASPVTGFTVTTTPGGATCTWTSGPLTCAIGGLVDGKTYTFTVTATNGAGAGSPSVPSLPTRIGLPGLSFHSMAPVRVLDSRGSIGAWAGALETGAPRALVVAGPGSAAGVPATAGAVVLNVTATQSTTNSFLTISPTGEPSTTSSLNFGPGQTIPNLVTVAVGTGGSITMATASGSVHVVADVVGYYDAAAETGFTAVEPKRILDSREALGSWNAKLESGAPRTLAVRGVGGVSATADAVVVNVTATNSTANSFLTVYPAGGSTPTASNLNFGAGETIPNLVTVKVGADGKIAFATAAGSVDVVADVVGFYDPTAGDRFHPLASTRLLDSRTATGAWNGPLAAGTNRTLAVAPTSAIAADATALVANATATASNANSFVTAFPAGTTPPSTSNLNFAIGQTIPNMVVVRLGPGGDIGFRNAAGTVHVIVDAAGWFAPV